MTVNTFTVKFGHEYNEKQKKEAASALVTTKGIVFFSTDMKTREFIVVGDVNRQDVVSKLKKLGGAELDEEKKQRRIKFRKKLSKTFSHVRSSGGSSGGAGGSSAPPKFPSYSLTGRKFRVKYGEYNEKQMKEAASALVSTKGIVFFSIDMKTRKFIVNGDGDVNPEDVVSKLKKLGDAELLPRKRVKIGKIISKSFKTTAMIVTMTAGSVAISAQL